MQGSGDKETGAPQNLMPAVDLILKSDIGHLAGTDVHGLFDQIGRELVGKIGRDCALHSKSRVLDLGCGIGRIARPFTEFLSPDGAYVGIDVVPLSIDWCRENYRAFPNFTFIRADVFNTHYNPAANVKAADYRFPLPSDFFDCVLSTSLFTHLLAADAKQYVSEIARVLKPGGMTWNSFFLLDEISEPLASATETAGRRVYLPERIEYGRVALKDDPEAVAGLQEDYVRQLHAAAGLDLVEVRHGYWSGRTDVTAKLQDEVIARKARSGWRERARRWFR